MRIKMLETMRGSQDGCSVDLFEKGRIYDILPNLACVFIRDEVAREADGWDEFIARLDNSPQGKLNSSLAGAMQILTGE